MTFLALLGAFFLFLIVKFLWDEKITNKEPVVNHRVPNSVLIKQEMLPINDRMEMFLNLRKAAFVVLASEFECSEKEVENVFKKEISDKLIECKGSIVESADFLSTMMAIARHRRDNECRDISKALDIPVNPHDTTGGLMLAWIQEAVQNFKYTESNNPRESVSRHKSIEEKKSYSLVYVENIYEATGGFIVVFKQDVLGVNSQLDELRIVEEFWNLEELAQANDGNGLVQGDQADGICISMVEEAGFPVKAVLEKAEDHQPNDRFID